MGASPRLGVALVIVTLAFAVAGIVGVLEGPLHHLSGGDRFSQWVVEDEGYGQGLCVFATPPNGLQPGCYYVSGRSDSRFDSCTYDSGWTIELGGKEDRVRRVLYGTVRSDATDVVATVGGGGQMHGKLSKPVEKQPYRFFVVEGVDQAVAWIDASLPNGRALRATRSEPQRAHIDFPPRWELSDSTSTMGWVHQFHAGCPG